MKKICIALIIVTALSIGAINTIGWIEKKLYSMQKKYCHLFLKIKQVCRVKMCISRRKN